MCEINKNCVNEEGFITESYWDQSLHLVTVDQDGNKIDRYESVYEELKSKENSVSNSYKKEQRKNKWINFRYDFQCKFLVSNIVLTFFSVFMYIVFVIFGKIDIIYNARDFLQNNLPASLYKKLCHVLEPANTAILDFIYKYGLVNIMNYTLMILSIISLVALIIFMISRDHITVRWATKVTRIKPLCKIKEESDIRVHRLESDLYNLQLRMHKAKFTTHDR